MARIEKRGNKFRIKVFLGYDFEGKEINKSITYTPKAKSTKAIEKEVQKFAIQYENECKNNMHPSGENMTFYNFSLEWLENYVKPRLTPMEYERYEGEMKRRIYKAIGNLKLASITARDCQKIFTEMEKKGLKPATIDTTKSILSSCFSYAYKQELINSNPVSKCTVPPRQKDNKIHCFNLEQTDTFLQALKLEYPFTYKGHASHNRITKKEQQISSYTATRTVPYQLQVYFNLAIMSGLRRSEEIALQWKDIDFTTNTVHVYKATTHTKEKGQFIKETKTPSSIRDMTIPKNVIDMLSLLKQQQKNRSIELGNKWNGQPLDNFDDNYIFIKDNGLQMHLDTPYQRFKHIIADFNELMDKKARETNVKQDQEFYLSKKLPSIRLHELRHTHATILLSEGNDIEVVSKRLGHAHASITLDVYGHALKDKDVTASNKLELLFYKKEGN